MPKPVHRTPRIRNHHQAAVTPRKSVRAASRTTSVVLTSLVMATSLPPAAARGPDRMATSPPRGCSYFVLTCGAVTRPANRPGPGSGARRLGEPVGVGAGVDGVQDAQLRAVQRPFCDVDGVGRVRVGPV